MVEMAPKRYFFQLSFAAALGFSIVSTVSSAQSSDQPGRTAEVLAGEVGQRQDDRNAVQAQSQAKFTNRRLSNRLETRVENRIDRRYNPRGLGLLPYKSERRSATRDAPSQAGVSGPKM